MKKYNVMVNGMKTTLLLNDEHAKARGLTREDLASTQAEAEAAKAEAEAAAAAEAAKGSPAPANKAAKAPANKQD